jgi:uncharacterized delta-60 repeat protein
LLTHARQLRPYSNPLADPRGDRNKTFVRTEPDYTALQRIGPAAFAPEGYIMRNTLKHRNLRDNARLMPSALRVKLGVIAAFSLLPAAGFAQEAGDLDASFGVGGKVLTDFDGSNDEGQAVLLQPDGRLVVAGTSLDPATGTARFGLARYLPDGSLDATFDGDGRVTTDFDGFALPQAAALQDDGKIVLGGYSQSDAGVTFTLARYLPNGALDVTFSGDGKLVTEIPSLLSDLAVQADGKIVGTGGPVIARFLPGGTLDATFGSGGVVTSSINQFAVTLQSDGKIVTAGSVFDSASGSNHFALARFLPNGTSDTTFDGDGRATTDAGGSGFAADVILQPDGRIVAAGNVFGGSNLNFAVVRYLPNGSLDTTFSGDGRVTTSFGGTSQAFAVTLQRDGKIVVAGNAFVGFGVARYLPNGTLDTTFSGDGLVTTDFGEGPGLSAFATDVVSQPDGRLVVVGASTSTGEGGFDFALARYESGLAPTFGPPTTKQECKNNGWRAFNVPRVFRNQGDCIQFVNTGH